MENLMELLKTRRTYRRFAQREISQEIVEEILKAARLASSAMNRQPLSYVVVKDADKVEEVFSHTRWGGALPDGQGQPKPGEEPVLFIGVVENTDLGSFYTEVDAGLAISNMTLAAWNHGVGSCIIGACDKEKLGEMFGLSEKEKLHYVVAFGYPTHESSIVDLEENGDFKYYLDESRNYMVPKRKTSDVVKYL